MSDKVANIIRLMREYQKMNNVKKQCITNAQTLYDLINHNTNYDVKVQAVYVLSYDGDDCFVCAGHVVVNVEGVIFDTSYDIYSLKDPQYFDNIKVLLSNMNPIDPKDKKELIKKHIVFKNFADKMNKDEFIITDRDHYHKQLDYIQTQLGMKIK